MVYLRKAKPGKMRVEFYELDVVGIATEHSKEGQDINCLCLGTHKPI